MTAMSDPMVSQLVASFSEYDFSEADKTAWRRASWLVLPTTCCGIIFTCSHGFLVAVPAITWPGRLIKPGTQEVTTHFCALLVHLYPIAVVLDLKNAVRAPTGWCSTLMAEHWNQFCQHYLRFSALPQVWMLERDLFCESKRYNCMLNWGVSFETSLLNFVLDKPYYICGSAFFRLVWAL